MPSSRHTTFSPCRQYRYTLWREWGNTDAIRDLFRQTPLLGTRDQYVQFIGLNPSTADETTDDPTIRRCIQFAKDWGYGAICMTNLFAFRATDPQVMLSHHEPVGPDNDQWLQKIATEAGLIVAAWGVIGCHQARCEHVTSLLKSSLKHVMCLGFTKHGFPKHPLYVPKNAELIPV